MRRGVRTFYVMGTLIVFIALLNFLTTPWSALGELIGEPFVWQTIFNLAVQLSVGFTEIAVGWLLDNTKTE